MSVRNGASTVRSQESNIIFCEPPNRAHGELPCGKSDGFLLNAKQLDELSENTVTQLLEPPDVLGCFPMDALGIDLPAERADFFPVFSDAKPAMNHRLVDLQVKLQAVNVRVIAKSLIGTEGRKSEMNGASGDIERVPVPLKNGLGFTERTEQGVPFRLVGRRNVIPADLFFCVGVDGRAQCFRDQLSTEANAQHGKIAAQRRFDQLHFRDQVGQSIRIVYAHGPAQNDQPMITVQAGLRFGLPREIDVS
jgi:hypothetical protein